MNSLSRFILRFLSVATLIPFFLTSCKNQTHLSLPEWPEWKYSDLRLMDSVNSSNPNMDFIALYTRIIDDEIQIRLDLLELQDEILFDLILAIDTRSGGSPLALNRNIDSSTTWDILIEADSSNNFSLHTSSPVQFAHRLRVLRNPTEDTLIISFSSDYFQRSVQNHTSIAAWIFSPGGVDPIDSIGPVKFFAPSPKPAPVVFYFWNLFEGASPAQSLRRWDGAHSGPDSARHGLKHLLNAAEKSQVPLILSDLNTPQNLSALDYLGGLNQVRQLAQAGLVSLPEVSKIYLGDQPVFSIPDSIYEKYLAWTNQVSQQFSLPNTQALVVKEWPSTLNFSNRYKIVFPAQVSPLSTARICFYGQVRVLCQVESGDRQEFFDPYSQVMETGFTVSLKSKLVNAAFLDEGEFLLLGGDFGLSSWGNQYFSTIALDYVRNHPWIRVLSIGDLQTWSIQPGNVRIELMNQSKNFNSFVPESSSGLPIPSGFSTEEINAIIFNEMLSLPESPLTTNVWQWYFGLLSSRSIKHHRLSAASIGQLGHLIQGVKWANNPYSLTSCELDLDWDGENECVLTSDRFFASLEQNEGALVIGLLRTEEGIQQFIAPTYQVNNGISDPFLWKPEKGYLGDPGAVRGAFIERANFATKYRIGAVHDGVIEFIDEIMSMRKIYILSDPSLEVFYQSPALTIVSGVFAYNPWERFLADWATTYSPPGAVAETQTLNFSMVQITSNAELTTNFFTSSRDYLDIPEDPNFDYTAGHNLLFPFGSFSVVGRDEFWIKIEWPR